MEPGFRFKKEYPRLDKIIHIVAKIVVFLVIVTMVHMALTFVLIFLPLPPVFFSGPILELFPFLCLVDPWWILTGFIALVVILRGRSREHRQKPRIAKRASDNIPIYEQHEYTERFKPEEEVEANEALR